MSEESPSRLFGETKPTIARKSTVVGINIIGWKTGLRPGSVAQGEFKHVSCAALLFGGNAWFRPRQPEGANAAATLAAPAAAAAPTAPFMTRVRSSTSMS